MKLLLSPKTIPVRLLSLAFSLWLGGVGCLAGCARMLLEADTAQSNSHACCHQARQKAESDAPNSVSGSMNAMSCCPLAGQKCAFTSKQQIPEPTAVQTAQPPTIFQQASINDFVGSFRRIRVPDRDGTYLRHCSFLI
jgi:hypothetical protein